MPYSNNVKKQCWKSIPEISWHFPKGDKINNLFNKNTIKVSYSCMKNMISILTSYNKKILAGNEKPCNCRKKDECPLENKYLTPWVIYEADVITINTSRKFYFGLSGTPSKERYKNHKRDFKNKVYEKSNELSKYIWSLQKGGIEFSMHWKILSHVNGMTKCGYCSLCLTEKLWLLHYFDDIDSLNKKFEFISKCRHETKLLISSIK